jgi:hypothetical protein
MLLVSLITYSRQSFGLRLPDIGVVDPEHIRANRLQIRRSFSGFRPFIKLTVQYSFDNFTLQIYHIFH